MNVIASGLTTAFNGVWEVLSLVTSPIGAAVGVIALSAAWLGLIEIELMDRSGSKPRVGRH